MSVLQSPRVKDGSQNMEVSLFVVDMTWDSWFIVMPCQSNLHDCLHVCPFSFWCFHVKLQTPADLDVNLLPLSFSQQQQQQQQKAPLDICRHLVQHLRAQPVEARQERMLHLRLLLMQPAPHMHPLLRWRLTETSQSDGHGLLILTVLSCCCFRIQLQPMPASPSASCWGWGIPRRNSMTSALSSCPAEVGVITCLLLFYTCAR